MNLFDVYVYLCLIVCISIGSSLTLPVVTAKPFSLYNQSDQITVLNSDDFFSTIYQSKTAWLVEFYASWCGHCRTYTQIYREIGVDTSAWQSVVRIAAINCYGGDNQPVCRQHSIHGYPSIFLIPPNAIFNQSEFVRIPATDAKYVNIEIVKGLESFNRGNSLWPRFTPTDRLTIDELYSNLPKSIKHCLIVVERQDDFTGRQLMLDFSKYYSKISIFRATTDGKLGQKFSVTPIDLPALFVILHNRTVQRLDLQRNSSVQIDFRRTFNQLISSYIRKENLIDDFQENIHLQPISQITSTKPNISDDNRDQFTIHTKVHMLDLEIALSYMFRYEIPQIEEIRDEAYAALKQWLNVLIKYLPVRGQLLEHFKFIFLKINVNSQGLTGDQFRKIFDMRPTKIYFPNDRHQYKHCAGSLPQYRGYSCALWTLFHVLTVSQYLAESQISNSIDVIEIPLAARNYVKHFFACRKCSENFMNETIDINRLNLSNKQEAVVYFWKIHNNVNRRLSFDVTEDPKHPKVQFPSRYLCQTCRPTNQHDYDLTKIMSFLLEYYSKDHLDQSIPMIKSDLKGDFHPEFLLSKDNRIEFISTGPGYLTRTFQRYSVYIFLGLLCVLMLIRRRYCKTASKHLYTLKRIL